MTKTTQQTKTTTSQDVPKRGAPLSSQRDDVLMAMNLYAEARGEYARLGDEALYAVAQVVMNRTMSGGQFPSSVKGVILQPYQFSWTNPGDPNLAAAYRPDPAIWRACLRVAREVIGGGGSNPVKGAEHYHARSVRPSWAKPSRRVATIGEHIFYDLIQTDNDRRAQAERARAEKEQAERAREQAERAREQAERAREQAERPEEQGGGQGPQEGGVETGGNISVPPPPPEGQGPEEREGGEDGAQERAPEGPPLRLAELTQGKAYVRAGDTGEAVSAIQRWLRVPETGVFDGETTAAVLTFKRQHHLGEAELVGETTWGLLLREPQAQGGAGAERGAGAEGAREGGQGQGQRQDPQGQDQQAEGQGGWLPAPSLAEVRAGQAVIKHRMKGDSVQEVQRLVSVESDGKFGDQTKKAVLAFKEQRSLGNGESVGATTLARLEEEAAERAVSADSAAQMARLLSHARGQAAGRRPMGWCYREVSKYIDAVGFGRIGRGQFDAKIPPAYWGYARNFAEYLNQGNNAARLGIKNLGLNNPYDAPAGAIVVVAPGTPGTRHATAGDIAVAAGDGTFYNDGVMGYGGREAWPPARGGVLGIYAPDL
jgi:peptidoglycan hydrolase-like protein with peptidoglycan-binding domain